MRGIHYLVLKSVLFVFFALASSPIVLPLVLLLKYSDAHESFRILKWLLLPVLLVWVFSLPWLASHTAQHIAFGDQKFGVALKSTFCELRLYCSFLPLVGTWFEFRSDAGETEQESSTDASSAAQATRYSNGPLPDALSAKAYLTFDKREFALSPPDAVAYLHWCREQKITVTGFEIWRPTVPGPTVLVGAGTEGDANHCESVIPQCVKHFGNDIVLNIRTPDSSFGEVT